jgi:putative transposase
LDRSVEEKRRLIEPEHPELSVRRQCQLLGLSRANLYYQPRSESEENLHLMRLLDEQYTRTPFYGVCKMTAWLRGEGHPVNVKRVCRLLGEPAQGAFTFFDAGKYRLCQSYVLSLGWQ